MQGRSEQQPSVPEWAAVIVAWNAGEYLRGCVESLLADAAGTVGTEPLNVEIVVVDNASDDDAVAHVASAFPSVRVVNATANLGFGRGANLGIAATRAPIVAVLNSDVVVRAGAAAAMTGEFLADPKVGAVGPRLVNPDGTLYPSARTLPRTVDAAGHAALGLVWPRNPFTRRYRQLDVDQTQRREVDWLSGAAIWLRREALDAVGVFDPRYFMYFEDVDLGWRLRRGGWTCVYQPEGELLHVQGTSTAQRPYRMIVEHHRSAWIHARDRYRGVRALALPAVGAVLGLRMLGVLGARAIGRGRRRPSVGG